MTASDSASGVRAHPAWHWRTALWLMVLLGYCGLALAPKLQERLGLVGNGVWFLDSYAILAAGEAAHQGLDPYQPNPLDVYQRPHVYTHWWLVLGRLGLTRDDNFACGLTLALLFLTVAVLGFAPRRRLELVWHAALLLSPPVLLAVIRANNDLVVFVVLGLGLWLAGRSAEARPGWFGGAVAVATGLKFFPVVAVAAAVVLRPVRRGLLWLAGLTALALLIFASVRADLARASLPEPMGSHVFGAGVFWQNLGWGGRGPVLVSLAILAVGAALLAMGSVTRGLGDGRRGPVGERLAFLTAAVLLLACFSTGISYAYRWVFAMWLAPWLWRQAWGEERNDQRTVARIGVGMLTLLLWADGLYCLATNSILGPLSVAHFNSLEAGWNLVMQPVAWAFMLLLAGWLAEALLAMWRERNEA